MSAYESMMSVLVNAAARAARDRRAALLVRVRVCVCTDLDAEYCSGGGLPPAGSGKCSCWCHASTTRAPSAG